MTKSKSPGCGAVAFALAVGAIGFVLYRGSQESSIQPLPPAPKRRIDLHRYSDPARKHGLDLSNYTIPESPRAKPDPPPKLPSFNDLTPEQQRQARIGMLADKHGKALQDIMDAVSRREDRVIDMKPGQTLQEYAAECQAEEARIERIIDAAWARYAEREGLDGALLKDVYLKYLEGRFK